MQPTLLRRANYGMEHDLGPNRHVWGAPQPYKTYRSKYGPQYKIQPHVYGINSSGLLRFGVLAGGMGAAAGIFAIFFFDGVPRVRKDILQKVPFIGSFFVHEIPPEDNPF